MYHNFLIISLLVGILNCLIFPVVNNAWKKISVHVADGFLRTDSQKYNSWYDTFKGLTTYCQIASQMMVAIYTPTNSV